MRAAREVTVGRAMGTVRGRACGRRQSTTQRLSYRSGRHGARRSAVLAQFSVARLAVAWRLSWGCHGSHDAHAVGTSANGPRDGAGPCSCRADLANTSRRRYTQGVGLIPQLRIRRPAECRKLAPDGGIRSARTQRRLLRLFAVPAAFSVAAPRRLRRGPSCHPAKFLPSGGPLHHSAYPIDLNTFEWF